MVKCWSTVDARITHPNEYAEEAEEEEGGGKRTGFAV